MVKYLLGLDLGQANDYTALSILQPGHDAEKGQTYDLIRLERTRGVSYPDIVSKIERLMNSHPLKDHAELIVDETGVGRPVVDLLRKAGLKPIAVFIHGGDAVTHEGSSYRVPKRDLVSITKIVLQKRRLKMSDEEKLGPTLQQELLNFNYKLNPLTAHDSYGCWREGQHDDLVLCVALPLWWMEAGHRPKPQPRLYLPRPAQLHTPTYRTGSYGSQIPYAPH